MANVIIDYGEKIFESNYKSVRCEARRDGTYVICIDAGWKIFICFDNIEGLEAYFETLKTGILRQPPKEVQRK